jgi:hypothetical protein
VQIPSFSQHAAKEGFASRQAFELQISCGCQFSGLLVQRGHIFVAGLPCKLQPEINFAQPHPTWRSYMEAWLLWRI